MAKTIKLLNTFGGNQLQTAETADQELEYIWDNKRNNLITTDGDCIIDCTLIDLNKLPIINTIKVIPNILKPSLSYIETKDREFKSVCKLLEYEFEYIQ